MRDTKGRQEEVQKVSIPFVLADFKEGDEIDIQVSEENTGLKIISSQIPCFYNECHVLQHIGLLEGCENLTALELYNESMTQADPSEDILKIENLSLNDFDVPDELEEERREIEEDMYRVKLTPAKPEIMNICSPFREI